MIPVRRDLVERAGEYCNWAPDFGDDIRRVDGEQRPYRLAPTIGRHRVAQALDMLPNQGWSVGREQPVHDRGT